MRINQCLWTVMFFWGSAIQADGPADNIPEKVRQIPPPGIEISADDRRLLDDGVAELGERIQRLKLRRDALTPRLLPDVEIFHRAVDQALRFSEFFNPGDIKKAQEVLAEGMKRAEALSTGEPYWTGQTGLVVRGFRSKLDDTVQPYGLVVPASWQAGDSRYKHRLDLWFHGRGETSCEVQFIHQRMSQVGAIEPAETFVLHPFGRYSNAFKFAGEVDVWEALEHAKQNYPIDDDRIAVRGFSMGGAGAWHFAIHYPDQFFAANPGAGFSETPEFLKSFQGETLNPPWYEERLWQLYDCPPWVNNLRMIPTIAYSGEIDKQKQAADIMAAACDTAGMNLTHIIGPQTAHKIHPESLVEIERRMREIKDGPRLPIGMNASLVDFTTYTLQYDRCGPVQILGVDEHWQPAKIMVKMGRIDVANQGPVQLVQTSGPEKTEAERQFQIIVDGVTDFRVRFAAGEFAYSSIGDDNLWKWCAVAVLDFPKENEWQTRSNRFSRAGGVGVKVPRPQTDGSWEFRIHWNGNDWVAGDPANDSELRKRHGLQGPIDDAFMDSFLFVTPSGACQHELVDNWVKAELEHAQVHWRRQMRGDVRIKADKDVTEEDIARHNLILWGDAASNSVLAKVLPSLPVKWTAESLQIGELPAVDAKSHAPILIYPNPLNPKRYVVLNSSFTYREYDYLNNARQTPKLPDWAIIDLTTPPDNRWPGKVAQADFFDERWNVKPAK